MSQHIHEELEVGQHLDQATRAALTGVAQVVERLARSHAERDRAAAQAMRDALYQQRMSPRAGEKKPAAAAKTATGPVIEVPTDKPLTGPDGERAREAAQGYLARTRGNGAEQVARAWEQAMIDVGARPADPITGEAARRLHEIGRAQYDVSFADAVDRLLSPPEQRRADPATTARDVAADLSAAAGDERAMNAAAAAADSEQAAVERTVLPAYRANPDRGVSPTKAATPAEAEHRRQTWAMTRSEWEGSHPELTSAAERSAAWNALLMPEKTQRYWKVYDTEQARTVTTRGPGKTTREAPAAAEGQAPAAKSERGFSPSKASDPTERLHRAEAWKQAEAEFVTGLPQGTSKKDARQAWGDMAWQDKMLRYWTAYDDPALVARVTAQAGPAAAAAAQAPGKPLSKARVVQLNEMAAAYFKAAMTPDSKGLDYLHQRVGRPVVETGPWRLGYAPDSWTGLTRHLRRAGVSEDEIVGAGLGLRSSRGAVVDAFRDRAMIGIRDEGGKLVGFVGRDLSGDPRAPKYTNTGQTAAYRKGDHLLGLAEAPAGARLVRVEGPMDAIAITAAGEGRYAGVAPLGTALTSTQAETIADRAGGVVWEALDADKAGVKATDADFWMMKERGVDPRMIRLPDGADPAQMWQDHPAELADLLANADKAPSAALASLEVVVDQLKDGLRNGEADAYEQLAWEQEVLTTGLSAEDTREFDQHSQRLLADLGVSTQPPAPAQDTTLDPATAQDVDQEAAALDLDRGSDDLDLTHDARWDNQPREPRAGDELLADTVMVAATAAVVESAVADNLEEHAGRYLRAGEGLASAAAKTDPEAADAARLYAASFPRSTSDMLTLAQEHKGTAATPARNLNTGQTQGLTRRM